MDDKVAEFVAITSASESTAAFYLESCGGSVEQAVQSFFDSGGAEAPAQPAPAAGDASLLAEAAAARAARAAAGAAAAGGAVAGPGPSSSRPAGGRRATAGNVRGLSDIGDEEEDDDDFNDYYVGGDKSGQVVRGAPKDKERGRGGDRVEDIFEGARAAGAEQGSHEDMWDEEEEEGEGGQRFRAFSGSARTLAGGDVAAPQPAAGQRAPERRAIKIVFYANGIFTVDDGEPRSVRDPASLPFMEAIMRGQLPPELDPGDPNVQVNVNLLRRDSEYEAPAQPRVKAFAGTGHKLSGDDGAGTSAAAGPPPDAAPGAVTWEGADASQPTTSIQLRLADGSRLRASFNLTHTVGDIRRFIRASRPDMAQRAFRLATAFPAQPLDDDSVTLQAAGLANSVIIQK